MKNTLMIVALLLLAGSSLAVPVDPNAADGVAAVCSYYRADMNPKLITVILTTNGRALGLNVAADNHSMEWVWFFPLPGDLPVPITDIADWTPTALTTVDGTRWFYDNSLTQVLNWNTFGVVIPPVPEGAVSTESQNMGNVKSMFR